MAWLARPRCSRARSSMACFQCIAPQQEVESPGHGSAACTAYNESSVSQKQPFPLTILLFTRIILFVWLGVFYLFIYFKLVSFLMYKIFKKFSVILEMGSQILLTRLFGTWCNKYLVSGSHWRWRTQLQCRHPCSRKAAIRPPACQAGCIAPQCGRAHHRSGPKCCMGTCAHQAWVSIRDYGLQVRLGE